MRLQHLRTNRQFMLGNMIVFLGVIVVVVLFVYMSLRMQAMKGGSHYYNEVYQVRLEKGFSGGDFTVFLNDSIVFDGSVSQEPQQIDITRFAEETSLLIVDKATEQVSVFELPSEGGLFRIERTDNEMRIINP